MKNKKNIYEDLEIVDFKDEDELVKYFLSKVDVIQTDIRDTNECVAIYGKSDFVYSMFQKIIKVSDCEVGALSIRRGYFDENESVFCVRIYDDNILVIEDAYKDDGKPYALDGIALMNENECGQDLIDKALECKADVILFGFESDELSKDKRDVDLIKDDDNGDIHGFFATRESDNLWSTWYFCTDEVISDKEVKNMLDLFYRY